METGGRRRRDGRRRAAAGAAGGAAGWRGARPERRRRGGRRTRRASTTRKHVLAGDAPAGARCPVTSDSLIPFSARSLRTIGESTRAARRRRRRPRGRRGAAVARAPAPAPGRAAVAVVAAAGGGGGGWRRRCGAAAARRGRRPAAAAGAARTAGAPAPSPITASFTPTSTVSPSGTRISVRTPAAGDGTSESTLSVETSKSGSSRSTASPTPFIQRVIVPSVTVSPSCGIITSANVQSPSGQRQHRLAEGLGQRRVRLDELCHLVGEGLPVDGQVAARRAARSPTGPTMCTPRILPGRPVGPPLGDDLHDALGVADDLGPAVAAEGVLLGDHLDARPPWPAPRSCRRRPPRGGSRWPTAPWRCRPARPARPACP